MDLNFQAVKPSVANNPYAVTLETFDRLSLCWSDAEQSCPLDWNCLFVLPAWLKSWWEVFGQGLSPYLCAVRDGGRLIGLAPLLARGEEAVFLGSPDVCDYQDFIVAPGRGRDFSRTLIQHLRKEGIDRLNLQRVRPDSTVLVDFSATAKEMGCEVLCLPEDVSLEIDLPASWDEFLVNLTGKERHEIRRKLRRLEEASAYQFRLVETVSGVRREMDQFLELFRLSRAEKAAFMNAEKAAFFRSLMQSMSELALVKLCFLDLAGKPAAGALCFDHSGVTYLYNSGYDPRFRSLSVGLLNKVLSIQASIQRGQKKYDFLKGAEIYKHRLGGGQVLLYHCTIKLR